MTHEHDDTHYPDRDLPELVRQPHLVRRRHDGVPWGGDALHSSADVTGETTEGEWLVGIAMSDGEPATLVPTRPGR